MLYVTEDLLKVCLESYLETTMMGMKVHEEAIRCPHCRERFGWKTPIMVQERDLEAFKTVIRAAEEYLGEKGVTQMMLRDMFLKIAEAIRDKRKEERAKLTLLLGGLHPGSNL